jgi:hypothetical protein
MSYMRQLTPEFGLSLRGEHILVNALVDDLSRETPAYIDRDGRVRVNSAALVRYPYAVSAELLRIGNGRWTANDAVRVTVAARQHVCYLAAANC